MIKTSIAFNLSLFLFAIAARAVAADDPNAPINPNDYKGKIRLACVGDSITAGFGVPRGKSYPDQLRKMLQGPPHVQGGDDEGNVALHEDFGAGNAPEADIKRMETSIGGAVMPGISSQDAAETVEGDFSEEAAPPDLDP